MSTATATFNRTADELPKLEAGPVQPIGKTGGVWQASRIGRLNVDTWAFSHDGSVHVYGALHKVEDVVADQKHDHVWVSGADKRSGDRTCLTIHLNREKARALRDQLNALNLDA